MTLCWRLKDDKFVVWNKPASGDKMAPFDHPEQHLDLVWFSSEWDYYKVAHHGSHGLTHQSVAGKTTTIGSVVMLGQTLAQDQLLYAHNLGYVPRYMIAIGGKLIQNMHPVQVATDQVRSVSFYATSTELRCINLGTSSASLLAAASVTYDVLLFRPPLDGYDPDEMMLSGPRGLLAKGIIRGTDVMLRRTDGIVDASPFDLSLSPAVDIDRGSVKWFHADGTTTVTGAYAGSFSAPTSIQMALTE